MFIDQSVLSFLYLNNHRFNIFIISYCVSLYELKSNVRSNNVGISTHCSNQVVKCVVKIWICYLHCVGFLSPRRLSTALSIPGLWWWFWRWEASRCCPDKWPIHLLTRGFSASGKWGKRDQKNAFFIFNVHLWRIMVAFFYHKNN